MKNLEELIFSRGMNKVQFANRVGVTKENVYAWVRGKHIPLKSVQNKMKNVLKCSIRELREAMEETKIRPPSKIRLCTTCKNEYHQREGRQVTCSKPCREEYIKAKKEAQKKKDPPKMVFQPKIGNNFAQKRIKAKKLPTREDIQKATEEFLKQKQITILKPLELCYEATELGETLGQFDHLNDLFIAPRR